MTSQKHILIITSINTFGGTRTYLANLLKYYQSRKVTISIAAENLAAVSSLLQELDITTIKLYNLPPRPRLLAKHNQYFHTLTAIYQYHKLGKIVKEVSPDLLIITPAGTGNYLSALAIDIPKLCVIHSYPRARLPFIYRIFQKLSRNACTFLTVSDYAKQAVDKHWEVNSVYIYNPPMQYVSKIKSSKPQHILTVGHLEWYKDPYTWINTVKEVFTRDNDFPYKFIWIGDGSLKQEIQDLIESNNLNKHCKLLSSKRDLSELYAKTIIYFQPSLMESQGISVLTAQAMGIPCIVTRVGGMQEMVVDGGSGYLVNALDFQQMGKRILELVGDKKALKSMQIAASKHAKNIATHQSWQQDMDSLHKDLGITI